MVLDENIRNKNKSNRFLFALIVVASCWYVFLCFYHHLNAKPLFIDEHWVYKNISEQLTLERMFVRPLLKSQMFPRAYLFLIQQINKPFQFQIMNVRAVSFVSMLLAFCVWLKIIGYEIKDRSNILIFVLSWAASAQLINYSSMVKQYSMDTLIASLFILFLYKQQEILKTRNKNLLSLLMFFLPALCLFSYPAFLFVAIPLYNMIVTRKSYEDSTKLILIYLSGLILFAFLTYYFDIRLLPYGSTVAKGVAGFGEYFVSYNSIGEFFGTFGEGVMNLFSRWFAERPRIVKKVAIFFVSFGIIRLFRRLYSNAKGSLSSVNTLEHLSAVLFLELFFLGSIKKYPFTVPRTSLFYCPIVFYLTIKGIDDLKYIHKYLNWLVKSAYVIFLVFVSALISRIIFINEFGAIPVLW